MKIRIFFLLSALALLLPLTAMSQETLSQEAGSPYSVPGKKYLRYYWDQPELYLRHQSGRMLDLAEKALDRNAPSLEVNLEREMAFSLIDAVMHEPDPIGNPEVLDFIARRAKRAAEDLDKPMKGRKSLKIYKLYNCSILFRTKDITVAVDLNGRNGRLVPDEVMEKIVDKIDILFYTHNHGDHIDSHVKDMCHKRGIPIYATDEIFKDDPEVHHVRYDGPHAFEIDHPKGRLTVNVLPGHQTKVHNNIWIVTLPNGKVVGGTGDQSVKNGEDLKWLKDIYKSLPPIDVLAMDCWIHDYDEHVADFRPKLIVSQHEDEIGGHAIDHREAFWLTIFKQREVYRGTTPWLLMAWGEWYDYRPSRLVLRTSR